MTYEDVELEDMERLNALASARPPDRLSFDEAFLLLENGSKRADAQELWDRFVAYYSPE